MDLHFTNSYDDTSWVSGQSCSTVPRHVPISDRGDAWGWWNIPPGGKAYVWNTDNQYAAYYAEATNGAVWTGPYAPVLVHPYAFDSALTLVTTAQIRVW
jgi:hypothetical protein